MEKLLGGEIKTTNQRPKGGTMMIAKGGKVKRLSKNSGIQSCMREK